MAHERPTLTAEPRQRIGSRYAKRLRRAGKLPAVVYGHQQDTVSIAVDEKELMTALHHGAHLVELAIDGKGSETCLVKELQFGYLGDNVIHIDFTRVDLEEEVTVQVHIHFEGEPAAAKEPGAVLTHDLTNLEIICKAGEIPDEIVVNLKEMESSITVGEIDLPPGVRTELDPETPVAHIAFVEELEEPEEVEVIGEEEPEVITEAKEEEEEAEEKPAKPAKEEEG